MIPTISVCMAIKNGAPFLRDQISSILPQLAVDDELIISDDNSGDDSINIIQAFKDTRIRVVQNSCGGIVSNFETSLRAARGMYLFLADQDDVWKEDKIRTMLPYLQKYDLVVSDCSIVDEFLAPINESFFRRNHSGKGILRNLFRNSYMGCCMAFHKRVLKKALPFPKEIRMHDAWIGLIGEFHFTVHFVNTNLVYHRRHTKNATSTSQSSKANWVDRINGRYWLLKKLIQSRYAF